MTNCRFDVVLLVKVVALVYCCCAFTPARHSLNAGVSAATLYPRDGHVVQLWTNNFTSVIHQSTKLWIVNFYLSWCGHCQRFALQYKQFAQDVEAWNSVVGVAAVVCSDQVNAALCREYGANSFPALKLFPPNAPPSPHSVEVHGDKTRASLPLVVLQYLDTLVTAGNADSSWPKLNFVRRPGDILSDFSGTVFIVVEDNDSVARHIGQMVILDLLNWRETVRVGRMSLADAGSLAVTARGLYGLTSFSQLYPISVEFGRHTIVEEILRRLSATALTSTASVNRLPTSTAIPRAMNGFHMQDLESSLYYSLWSEVPARATIENEALEALKRHINVMHKYLPAESHIVNFLRQTNNWLKSRTGSLSSTDWLNYITNSQNADAFVPSRLQWSGCQGSQPQFRGYPCSLWMTFHALTVNAYLREANNGDYTADEVIASIRGYVEHFLSCRDCADHFARAARSLLDVRNHTGAAATSVPYQQRRDGAVIWLWVAHNRANSRLRNDVTEDPIFPKVQFPGPELCPRCRLHDVTSVNGDSGNVAWNETAVLEFLTQFYGAPNIVDDDVHEEFSDARPTAPEITWPSSAMQPTTEGYRVIVQDETPGPVRPSTCQTVSTNWTPCSKTCNVGISVRLTNDNDQCKMETQVQLCFVRPCNLEFPQWNRTTRERTMCQNDGHTYQLRHPQRLKFANCTTVDAVKWRVCGQCPPRSGSNRPVCCRPAKTTTRPHNVNCTMTSSSRGPTAGQRTVRQHQLTTTMLVEVIEFCRCDERCTAEDTRR